jgi:hypothetical protein
MVNIAASESRTIAAPDKPGVLLLAQLRAAPSGGTLTLAFQGKYDGTNTNLTATVAGSWALLVSVLSVAAGGVSAINPDTFVWRVVDSSGFTGDTVTSLSVLALNAAGTVQNNAASLSFGYDRVTVPSANNGVILPVGVAGASVLVKVATAGPLCVYPPIGGSINALAANAPYNVANNAGVSFVAFNASQWDTIPLVAS